MNRPPPAIFSDLFGESGAFPHAIDLVADHDAEGGGARILGREQRDGDAVLTVGHGRRWRTGRFPRTGSAGSVPSARSSGRRGDGEEHGSGQREKHRGQRAARMADLCSSFPCSRGGWPGGVPAGACADGSGQGRSPSAQGPAAWRQGGAEVRQPLLLLRGSCAEAAWERLRSRASCAASWLASAVLSASCCRRSAMIFWSSALLGPPQGASGRPRWPARRPFPGSGTPPCSSGNPRGSTSAAWKARPPSCAAGSGRPCTARLRPSRSTGSP